MKEYFRKPNIAKNYDDMFMRKSERQLHAESPHKHSEFKKPYMSESYDDMEQFAAPSFNFPVTRPPGWDYPSDKSSPYGFTRVYTVPGQTIIKNYPGSVVTTTEGGSVKTWTTKTTTTKTAPPTVYWSNKGQYPQWTSTPPPWEFPGSGPTGGNYRNYRCDTNDGCYTVGAISKANFFCTFPPGKVDSEMSDSGISSGGRGVMIIDDTGGTSTMSKTVYIKTPNGDVTGFFLPACDKTPCLGDDGNPVGIGYTSQQMSTSGTQTLTVSNPKTGTTYTWNVASGGGSIDSGGTYTAPATNANCANNPQITLSDGGTVCATLSIAVNNPAQTGTAGVGCCCDQQIGALWYHCYGLFYCTGAWYPYSDWRCPANYVLVGNTCAGAGLSDGITDTRTGAQIAAGCCPSQLL